MERLLVHKETWVLCANMVRKDVACPRMQLFEADNEMTAITWESSQERFRHLLGFSWEEECWEGLFSFDLWADVGESCFLSPRDWPSHPSIPLCRPQSGSVPTLPAVQTCGVCKDPDDSLSCYRCHGDYSSSSGSHGWKCSQIPAGGWTIMRPTSGSCGSSEPIQAPQFHECYGWHSSLPHYRTSPLSCSWIHFSPWLGVPHRSPLLVGHIRTFINWAVFSGRWRSPWF